MGFRSHEVLPRDRGRVRLRQGRWRVSSQEPQAPQSAAGSDHVPVLLKAAVDALVTDPSGSYLDGTFGRGGHSREILRRLTPTGRLLGLDRDPDALAAGRSLADDDQRFALQQAEFAHLEQVSDAWQPLTGVLLDVGVSSPQLDRPERGFSFMADGPLDMRMDPGQGVSAAQFLAESSEQQIAQVLKTLGEERFARRIARAIKNAPEPLTRTHQLAELVSSCVPRSEPGKNPATRTFQALRIAVNDELGQLEQGLEAALKVLAPGGRLVVISFHSLEDRLVKRFIRRHGAAPGNRRLPPAAQHTAALLEPVGKPQRADEAENESNPRARSAIMRVARRVRTEKGSEMDLESAAGGEP